MASKVQRIQQSGNLKVFVKDGLSYLQGLLLETLSHLKRRHYCESIIETDNNRHSQHTSRWFLFLKATDTVRREHIREEDREMVSPLLQIVLPFATTLLVGGIDLNKVFIEVDPTEVEGNKGDVLLNVRSDQVAAGGNLNGMGEEIVGWLSLPKNTWIRVGNKMFYLLKDTEERQKNGRILILKKRDSYNMEGKNYNMKYMENNYIRILKNYNMDGKIRILKKQDNFNMDGKIRILKKRDNVNMEDMENNFIRILKNGMIST